MTLFTRWLLTLSCLLVAGPALGVSFPRSAIPEPLRPWVDWVLHEQDEALCGTLNGSADQRRCWWPRRLDLEVDAEGGRFRQAWTTQRRGWVPLPGNAALWPQAVEVDGTAAAVIPRDGLPGVLVEKGEHLVAGVLEWSSLPEMIPIPPATGLLALRMNGEPVPFPDRDAAGQVWLQRRETTAADSDLLTVSVHRLVTDDIPLQLTTRISLKVSGRAREVQLGKVLPDGFVPMSLESPLPARFEASNHLRLQIRPGQWELQLHARHEGPVEVLSAPAAAAPWDDNEVWAFQAQPHLRVVSVEGVDGLDPNQTELPPEWGQLPAYLMPAGASMRLVERRRGDSEPAPDSLQLERTLWLDFDGGGYTLHDRITGTLSESWRLEMPPPTNLGRVAVGGQNQYINRLDENAAPGVEIRQGALELDADARLEDGARELSAVSWSSDFQSVASLLNLPPGWRLLATRGVDAARPTWISDWTLFDLFVVLITALATVRLWGVLWGGLTLVALGLTFTEPEAPRWVWLAVLAAEGLVRALPQGRLLQVARLARLGAIATLLVVAIPFAVQQARQGLYPSLERVPPASSFGTLARPATAPAPTDYDQVRQAGGVLAKRGVEMIADAASSYRYEARVDPNAVVQTGPGLPAWSWSQVSLRWQGPVERAQRYSLLLIPPWLNRVLAFARTLLLALIVARFAAAIRPQFGAAGSAAALALALSSLALPAVAADFPSNEILDELRRRLLEPPDCHPSCASISRMRMEVGPATLRARLAVEVAADTSIPLPGSASQWLPATVLVDDQPNATLLLGGEGNLWLHLPAGRHEVLLEGALPNRDSVQISLPLKPYRVEARTEGWSVAGIGDNAVADDSLQLSRLQPQDGATTALEPATLPPFVRVERTLHLLLSWQVETRVIRLTPPGAGVLLEVPLLAGESVTTAGLRVIDGKAQVSLPPLANELIWTSTIAQAPTLTLRAPESVPWAETWTLDASPIWHVETDGIPTVHNAAREGDRAREWRPWPGESVSLRITRPAGVPGQSLTIDRCSVAVAPGRRATDVTLSLGARSSRGGQHTLTLPEGALLLSSSINGNPQPIRQEGRSVVVPISPGAQSFELTWRESRGITSLFRTPLIDIGAASVNVDLSVSVPADRWVLLMAGPRLGPAVLFWSNVVVVLLVAIALGRVQLTPLRTHQWFLLGLGLTQVPVSVALVVVGWLLALGWRQRNRWEEGPGLFNLTQIILVVWTVAALAGLLWAIEQGLLGLPEMQIAGNGSSSELLRWYADRSGPQLPQASVVSVPLFVYRLAMLAWALWIAQAVLHWLRWGWQCFSAGGYWRPMRLRSRRPAQPAPGQQ